jgi:hypothetical protein
MLQIRVGLFWHFLGAVHTKKGNTEQEHSKAKAVLRLNTEDATATYRGISNRTKKCSNFARLEKETRKTGTKRERRSPLTFF